VNTEIKAKWVAALRSGEYKQIKGNLKTSSGYCCLGVLCEIDDIEFVESNVSGDGPNASVYTYLNMFVGPKNSDTCIKMNDNGKSFNEIADWIEANL
jgi:hypothetical protein